MLQGRIDDLIEIGSNLPDRSTSTEERAKLISWETRCLNLIEAIFTKQSDYYQNLHKSFRYPNTNIHKQYGTEILKSARKDLLILPKADSDLEPLSFIEQMCSRFHLIARQLRDRHENRQTLDVNDEYDVQDLMHSLLKIRFGNIRPEEWTPSYAGGSSRMDFLLKNEGIVIETKKTRKGLGPKELGDQLIIDIGRYKTYPDVKLLFYFVYDPEGRIANPEGLEKDLTRINDEIVVKVLVAPKGI